MSIRYVILVFLGILLFSNCAKKGSPSGGPKDTIPPIILKSDPENFSIHFSENEIRIYFDEFIKLKDLQQNLIVSPPLTYQPIITPTSSAKMLKIRILDTLAPNTTYVFNFGKSIVDNNEENEFDYFTYVFSTGNYIDSLKLKGTVEDILQPLPELKTTVMLYEVTEDYNDSIIYAQKPKYITTTRDKDSHFELTNLKAGTYSLIALQESTSNYTFDPKKDKIAFLKAFVKLPTDSTFDLKLFQELPDYKMMRANHESKNKITFGFEGNIDSLKIRPLFELPEGYESRIYRDPKKDSLNYWFKPAFDPETTDTLTFAAEKRHQLDILLVKVRDLYDSLKISTLGSSTLIPRDSIKFQANTPLVAIRPEMFSIINQDSVSILPKVFLDTLRTEVALFFEKKDEQAYRVLVLPEAIRDFFEQTNDTLQYTFRTKPLSDYGTLNLVLNNLREFPVMVELVDEKLTVVASEYLTQNKTVYFDYLNPGKYWVRIVYDANGNRKWDTGNYLKKTQPETIVYLPKQIEMRPNWSMNEEFNLE